MGHVTAWKRERSCFFLDGHGTGGIESAYGHCIVCLGIDGAEGAWGRVFPFINQQASETIDCFRVDSERR